MAFAKASREKHVLTGSDDSRAPDYVKLPALQPRRQQEVPMSHRKDQLPRMLLKVSKPKWRRERVSKLDSVSSCGDLISMKSLADQLRQDHPLESFAKPSVIKFSGRARLEDGQLSKITGLPYNAEESSLARQHVTRHREAAQLMNRGQARLFPIG
mmetsp:Transcript_2316/g.4848  ORF Transcript_2316/g.4848 Transcript_2316/m.4848 type:complete len:156 (+) Transcript_2316:84-551(+)